MGSRKKTVADAQYVEIYNNKNNKPKELFVNRLLNSSQTKLPMGTFTNKEDYLSLEIYFKSNKLVKTKVGTARIFDAQVAVDHSPHPDGTVISSHKIQNPDAVDFIKADYMDIYDDSVTITSYTSTATSVSYTLSNGYSGSTPIDDRQISEITYSLPNGDIHIMYAFNNEYTSNIESDIHFLFDKVKNDGDKKPTKNAKQAFWKFGTYPKQLYKYYEEDKLKDILYSFCAKADDPIIEELYGQASGSIVIDVGDNDTIVINGLGTSNVKMTYDGKVVQDGDGNNLVAIPLEYFKSKKILDKYIYVKKYFGFIFYSTDTVEVSFFQSFFFHFLIAIVSIAFAFFTGGASLALETVFAMGVSYVLSTLDPSGVLSTVFAIATMNFSAIQELTLQSVSKIANTASMVVSSYAKLQFKNTLEEIEKLTKEERDVYAMIQGYKRQYLHNQLGLLSSLDSSTKNLLYSQMNSLNSLTKLERDYYG